MADEMAQWETQTHIGLDGRLSLETPPEFADADVTVRIVLRSVEHTTDGSGGWPAGFFEETFGSCADDLITRPAQNGDPQSECTRG